MYEAIIEQNFTAAHYITLPDGTDEEPHEHEFHVRVWFEADELDKWGMVTEFHAAEQALTHILEEMSGTLINELPIFADQNPTAEVMALTIYERLRATLGPDGEKIARLMVEEAPGCWGGVRTR